MQRAVSFLQSNLFSEHILHNAQRIQMRDLINFVICKVTFQSFDQRIETAVVYQFAIIFDTVKVRTEADD